ncbi:putative NADH-ubiquinone reductase complex 1 MLRQ subunit [Lupinus albus]|uniref:Putative NADH-ubiquinone reductase complex 1 MLRQ subunit n=1 Tax=Lupinus albus TaxID=3870 RepID=A0A6A4NMB1_LUPAL|nr:putative NADH-ubiquinone reductase complex 1 MLRQ subunit [Lupinus albus]
MQLVRNISTNPEVRVKKENRTAGILDNHEEGEKYSQHFVRKFVRGKTPQIMPSLNKFFSDPNLD